LDFIQSSRLSILTIIFRNETSLKSHGYSLKKNAIPTQYYNTWIINEQHQCRSNDQHGTPGDTFLRPGTSVANVLQDNAVSPTISLGLATTNRIFVFDANNSGGLNSRIGFGTFSAMFQDGDNASDLNGIYPTTIPFSFFEPGTYNPILGFTNLTDSLTDIGSITLNIIPEPSSLLLLSFGILGLSLKRSRR